MICPIHNSEFKVVPAGVSKRTGKSYDAFYACPEKFCNQKPVSQAKGDVINDLQADQAYIDAINEDPYAKPSTNISPPLVSHSAPKPINQNDKPDWDAISRGKVRHGVAVAYIELGRELDMETKAEMDKWVDYIMGSGSSQTESD